MYYPIHLLSTLPQAWSLVSVGKNTPRLMPRRLRRDSPFQKTTRRVCQTGPLSLPRSDSLRTISHPSTVEEKLMTGREGGERERRKEEGGGGKEGVRQASSPHQTCSSFKGAPSQVLTAYPVSFSS